LKIAVGLYHPEYLKVRVSHFSDFTSLKLSDPDIEVYIHFDSPADLELFIKALQDASEKAEVIE